MSETLPRWGLNEVNFVESDPEKVQAEMFSAYTAITGRTLAPGDPVRLFILTIANIIIQQRAAINHAGQQNLLSYAQGEFLDALGLYMGVSRNPAASASTTFRFTIATQLNEAYVIPAGFEITNGLVTFATTKELVIPVGYTQGDVVATCTTAGTAGNGYTPGQVSTIVSPMTFLETASNLYETIGGSWTEDDASFAERIRLAPNAFSVAGPKKMYEYYAKSASEALADVSVSSPRPGWVLIVCLAKDTQFIPDGLTDTIYKALSSDDIRPLTDKLVVRGAQRRLYPINVDYWINKSDEANADTIRANVAAAVEAYRSWQVNKIGRDITPGKLIANVINAGAARIDPETLQPSGYDSVDNESAAWFDNDNISVNFMGYQDE